MALANFSNISRVFRASGKMQSAPASTYIFARSTAASNPSTPAASVRAMMTMSRLAFLAAATLAAMSSAGTKALPFRWPHFLGSI